MLENEQDTGMTTDDFLDGWENEVPETQEFQEAQDFQTESESPESTPEEAETKLEPAPESKEAGPEIPETQSETPQDSPVPAQNWTLNFQGRPVSVNEANLLALAQAGLAYKSQESQYETAKETHAFFSELAQRAGITPQEYIRHVREQLKQSEGMSVEEARRAIELEDREKAIARQEEAQKAQAAAAWQAESQRQAAENRKQADCQEFMRVFPEAAQNPQEIPPEVWADVRDGHYTLVGAYAKYLSAQAAVTRREKEAAIQQNQANAARTAGSMRSVGNPNSTKDPFLEGFFSD